MTRKLHLDAVLGRADLLRALAGGGEACLEGLAERLDYQWKPTTDSSGKGSSGGSGEGAGEAVEAVESESGSSAFRPAPVPFWRLVKVEFRDPEDSDPEEPPPPLTLADFARDTSAPLPAFQPWIPWPELRRALDLCLRTSTASRRLDTTRLVDAWARRELVEPLPRLARKSVGQRPLALVDRCERLEALWQDQDLVLREIEERLGAAPETAAAGPDPDGLLAKAEQWADVSRIIAVSDFGARAVHSRWTEAWLQLGRRLRGNGCELHGLAMGCPDLDPEVASVWSMASTGHRETLSEHVELLLALASPALRLERPLLRALRLLIPGADADVELEVWRHEAVESRQGVLHWEPDARRAYFKNFRELSPSLRHAAARLIGAHHARLPPELQAEERLGLLLAGAAPSSTPDEEEALIHWTRRMARTIYDSGTTDARIREGGRGYILRSAERLFTAVGGHSALSDELSKAWLSARPKDPEARLPAALAPGILKLQEDGVSRAFQWVQAGDGFSLVEPGSPASGSFIAPFETRGKQVWTGTSLGQVEATHFLDDGPVRVPCPTADNLILDSGARRLTLDRFQRPAWASSMGRDRYGLWAAFEIGDVEHRVRWIPPGRFLMGSPESEPGRYEWEGPQHMVTVTRGFWLGETPVTQDLWQELKGDNPSRYQSLRRPVEQVNWTECREFCELLSRRFPGTTARLPTEAEWEYACRAGTRSALYTGDIEILGERSALDDIAWYSGNSGVDFDFSEQGVGSSDWDEKQYPHEKAGTRNVGEKAPNPWGLLDMLGNVLEWCEDAWDFPEPYAENAVFDPCGRSGARRVIRGGSWGTYARYVRAAYRFGYEPGDRSDGLGFRLALGQGPVGEDREDAEVG